MKQPYISRRIIALSFIALTAIFASCSNVQLPEELKLTRVLYEKEVTHTFGPGGINHSFSLYELPKKVAATIGDQGLTYINSLPSVIKQKRNFTPPTVTTWSSPRHLCNVPGCPIDKDPTNMVIHTATGPYWAPFVDWHTTPVPKDTRWLRYGDDQRFKEGWKPSISTFYRSFEGDSDEFISSISPEYSESFNTAISTPGNYYTYGGYRGMCLVVVSPKAGKAFYLFRD